MRRPAASEQSADNNCSKLRFKTDLEPATGASAQEIGTILPVVRTDLGPGTAFVAIDEAGEPVGTILDNVDRLIHCTALGVSFEAEVINQFFGTHTVKVRAS